MIFFFFFLCWLCIWSSCSQFFLHSLTCCCWTTSVCLFCCDLSLLLFTSAPTCHPKLTTHTRVLCVSSVYIQYVTEESLFFKLVHCVRAICCLKMWNGEGDWGGGGLSGLTSQRKCVCVGAYTPLYKRKSSQLLALKEMTRRRTMERQERGEWGNSLRALAISYTVCCSYLYRNIFILLKFQTCEALSWPHGTAKEKKKGKLC